jgi:hypothetical protein
VGGQVWQLCGVGVVGYKPTTPPQPQKKNLVIM